MRRGEDALYCVAPAGGLCCMVGTLSANGFVLGSPGYPAAGPGVDYLAAAGVAQYPPGTGVHPAAALASLAAAAAAGQHGASSAATSLVDHQPSSASNAPTAAGDCKSSVASRYLLQ